MDIKAFEELHRLYFASYEISFWKENRAAVREDADNAIVHVGSWTATFKLPDEETKLRHFGYMLEGAYERGFRAKAKEVRKVLGVEK